MADNDISALVYLFALLTIVMFVVLGPETSLLFFLWFLLLWIFSFSEAPW
jgi:hypothetical protein